MGTYALAVGIVKRLELHNVGVSDDAHDLQLAVLRRVSRVREADVPAGL